MSGHKRTVRPAPGPLVGRIRVPGDKSIAHRAVLFNAAATGIARVENLPDGADVASTLEAVAALGCVVERQGPSAVTIAGRNFRFVAPARRIDCGNSGTTMRLLMGLLSGQRFRAELDGDASLRGRPMERVAGPLREMGARVSTREGRPPVVVEGGHLHPIVHSMRVASAQLKSALLLAALQARGRSVIREPMPTRDHSERMLRAMGAQVTTVSGDIFVDGPAGLQAIDVGVCGDASSAAFFAVAASIVSGSRLTIEDVGLNPSRLGFVTVLRRMGAGIETVPRGERAGEPFGDLEVVAAPLRATSILAGEVPTCIDELPVLAVAAAMAAGTTTMAGAEELRVKESDRITTVAALLRAWGVRVDERADGLSIEGTGGKLLGGGVTMDSQGDHRIAMAAAVGALVSSSDVVIENADAAMVSFPRFFDVMAEACA